MVRKSFIKDIGSCLKLSNNINIPILGFGVYALKERNEFEFAVNIALENGYRHFDTASIYGNEEMLGKVLKKSGIDRTEIFITTKLWKSDYGYDTALDAFNASLKRLNMDYVDLYLIHWPQNEKLIETWKVLENIYFSGKSKVIGVSNFTIDDLNLLIKNCQIKPMVNQFEHHPYLQQKELVDFCFNMDIQVIAHSPLMWGRILNDKALKIFSDKYKKSIAQIVLRWNLQKGIAVIPKSSHKNRIIENADIFDFNISDNDMELIDSLDENCRIGGTP